MPLPSEVRGPAPQGDRPAEDQAAAKQLDGSSVAFVVIALTPAGRYRRRAFLSLHSATAAVQRARAKGQPARLVLCQLVPVAADLDLSGE
jgi:hypothetical protein